jgi:hypothetical protein
MRKVVLFACERSHRTPVMPLRSGFTTLVVAGIGSGDEVVAHFVLADDSKRMNLREGLSPIPSGVVALAIEKIAGHAPSPTNVELVA